MSDAGIYTLFITNSYGSISSNLALTVNPLVFRLSAGTADLTTNGFLLRLDNVVATNRLVIESTTNFLDWVPAFTNSPATGSVLFVDPLGTGLGARFYRATEQ
jgi:hypothetical protein